MRNIGNLPGEHQARLFSDYLVSRGIENDAEPARDGSWAIWVHDEEHLAQAGEELARFIENPELTEFGEARHIARKLRDERRRDEARTRTRFIDLRTKWGAAQSLTFGPVT